MRSLEAAFLIGVEGVTQSKHVGDSAEPDEARVVGPIREQQPPTDHVQRPDGSRVLDVRILLQTDDGEKIYVSWHGIAYTPPGGAFNARILPVFETMAPKYAWLNNVVAVGVYRADLGKIAYRIYRL